jgi:tetratricopeptide (TPR) repeat protein
MAMEDKHSSDKINVSNNVGDVIGVGVGDGNIIGKNISIVINEFSQDCGLTLIHPSYFNENNDVNENLEQWKNGHSFHLESVYQKKEFRRENLLEEIKLKLEDKKRLLLLGESGMSKTTLLMEIICDYFDMNYKVLYNLGNVELRNADSIVKKIKELAYGDNKILIVVDDVQTFHASLIFSVMINLQSLKKVYKEKIRFLLSAREPEFTWILERNMLNDTSIIEKIEQLFEDDFRFSIPPFTLEDTKEFIAKYWDFLDSLSKYSSAESIAKNLYSDTRGHPVLVKFGVLKKGLRNHVRKLFVEYILENSKVNSKKLTVVMLNCVFDISSVPLNEQLLEKLNLLDTANSLNGGIIKQVGPIWKTISPKWDLEFLKHVFSYKSELNLINNLIAAITSRILNDKNITNVTKLLLLNTFCYKLVIEKIISIATVEKLVNFQRLGQQIEKDFLYLFYSTIMGLSYYDSKNYPSALRCFDIAIDIDSSRLYAHHNKGLVLFSLEEYDEAIIEFDKAISNNSKAQKSYYHKGLALYKKCKFIDASASFDKAIELSPHHVPSLYAQSLTSILLNKKSEAKRLAIRILKIEPNNSDALKLREALKK